MKKKYLKSNIRLVDIIHILTDHHGTPVGETALLGKHIEIGEEITCVYDSKKDCFVKQ